MNLRLRALLSEAVTRPEAEQDELADLVESFLASHDGAPPFTAEELAHLDRLMVEPFVEADPAEVAAFFAGRASS